MKLTEKQSRSVQVTTSKTLYRLNEMINTLALVESEIKHCVQEIIALEKITESADVYKALNENYDSFNEINKVLHDLAFDVDSCKEWFYEKGKKVNDWECEFYEQN